MLRIIGAAVVATFNNRVEYSRALLALEELRGRGALLALAGTDGSLLSRIHRILGNRSHDPSYSPMYSWPALLLGLSLGLMICQAAFAADGDGKDLLVNAAAHAGDKEITTGEFRYMLFVEKQPPTKEMIAARVEEVRKGLHLQVERLGENDKRSEPYQKAIANANESVEPQMLEQASRTMKFYFLLGASSAGEDQWRVEFSILDRETEKFRPPSTVLHRTLTGGKHLSLWTVGSNAMSTSNSNRQHIVINRNGVYPGSQDPRRLGRLIGFLDTPKGLKFIDSAANIKVSRVAGAQNGSLREVTCPFNPQQKSDVTVRCQIDPSRGYITPLIQEIDDKGRLMKEWVCDDYFRATGTDLWFPKRCVYRTMSKAGGGLTDLERYEFSQDGVMLNIDIPAKQFSVTLQPKDDLLDSNGKESTNYSVAKELQISLDDLDDLNKIEGLKVVGSPKGSNNH